MIAHRTVVFISRKDLFFFVWAQKVLPDPRSGNGLETEVLGGMTLLVAIPTAFDYGIYNGPNRRCLLRGKVGGGGGRYWSTVIVVPITG